MTRGESVGPDHADWIQAALAGSGDAVIFTDAIGRVTFMNRPAEELTGWPGGEAIGRPLNSVFHLVDEQTRQRVTDPVARVLATGEPAGLANHVVLLARTGTEWVLDDGAVPIRDAAGAVAGVVLIFRDVTARRRAEREAADALAFAEGIVEAVRESLVVLGPGSRVKTANRAFYRTFRTTPDATEGRSFFDLGGRHWDVPGLREALGEVFARDRHFDNFEIDREFEHVGRRRMILNARRLSQGGGRDALALLAVEDATERGRTLEALSASETRYRRLFETAQDGILILDAATCLIFDANPFLSEMLGYGPGELAGKALWEIGLFRDVAASKTAFRELQDRGYIRYDDLPLQTRDGRRIEVEFVSNVYTVGDARVIQCNVRDVTDRKRAEEALRAAHDHLEARVRDRTGELARANEALTAEIGRRERAEAARQDLLQRLATGQEEERRRIARELHDQMGQHLAALGLGLKFVKDATPPSPARDRLHHLQELTDRIGKDVHDIALELRPTALDDFGLRAAMSNYAEGWSERAGVEVDFQAFGLDQGRLPMGVETALYRVVQEALTNVLRHARAGRVSVVVQRTPSHALAVVEDDGDGFDAEAVLAAGGSGGRLGLIGMRERVELVGGSLTVERAPVRGTTVIARVPLSADGGHGDG
jgi:PAS domain S-box-containing protein